MPRLFFTYCIIIFKYLRALYVKFTLIHEPWLHLKKNWAWDFSRLRWVIWLIIMSFYLFIQRACPSFNGSTCYPYLLGMSSPKCYCICHLFPMKWSPYSSWCSGTYWNQHFSLPTSIIIYPNFITHVCLFLIPPFQKSCGTIISSLISLFDKPPTRGIFHTSSRCSLKLHMNTSLILCEFIYEHLVIN
jgi:hypothetical protein